MRQTLLRPLPACLILAAVAGYAVALLYAPSGVSSAAPPGPPGLEGRVGDGMWEGVASCASASCHGGNGPRGSKGSEYQNWITQDPHSRSYATLFDDRSRLIERNLRKLPNLESAHPEKNSLCLSCHSVNVDEAHRGRRFSLDDGIGCESCHGPSGRWRDQHHLPGWQAKSDREKRDLGLLPTKDLGFRTQLCAGCHVGSGESSVNHDLIAAGHPQLRFELGVYHARLPKHWDERAEKANPARNPNRDFEARAWALGQLQSARAALRLLEERARSEDQSWPEFADYDCYACHHRLQDAAWRRQPAGHGARPGSLPLATWYFALPRAMAGLKPLEDKRFPEAVRDLQTALAKTPPDRREVAERAQAAITELDGWQKRLEQTRIDPASVRALLSGLADNKDLASSGWESAAQLYLALAALEQALVEMDPAARDPALRTATRRLADALAFPPGFSSPRDFAPGHFDARLREIRERVDRVR